jgi:hypothetical protein
LYFSQSNDLNANNSLGTQRVPPRLKFISNFRGRAIFEAGDPRSPPDIPDQVGLIRRSGTSCGPRLNERLEDRARLCHGGLASTGPSTTNDLTVVWEIPAIQERRVPNCQKSLTYFSIHSINRPPRPPTRGRFRGKSRSLALLFGRWIWVNGLTCRQTNRIRR